ncbi:MAG: chloride channel protein [Gammaproteobacteria bacterium]
MNFKRFHQPLSHYLDEFRVQLARPDAILPLSLLGMLAGILAGLTIIALRLLVEWAQTLFYPGVPAEVYENLPSQWRLLAPLLGGLVIGVLFRFTSEASHRVGVLHILERLAYFQGRLPWRNALIQFFGGAISMISGHSVGREGPSAHLGAASSNLPAQALALPNNSLRILAASGAAAGIAASFNTPLAGAAFAMEVLLMEYTVAGFAPVILATVSATTLTRAVFGHDLAYTVPSLSLGSLSELPYILLAGILIGLLATGFNQLFQLVSSQGQKLPVVLRLSVAGLLVGLCGLAVPEVMGIGDDTVNLMLLGEPGMGLLLAILLMKIIATCGGIGLGLPGGIIGPALFIGAAAGGLLGSLGAMLGFYEFSSIGLYAMIGMGAMMAGVLQAPLAGLIAILELTGNPNFILPGMLGVVAATISSGYFGRRESIFQGLMRSLGLDYRNDPVAQSLRRVGVAGVMNRRVTVLPRHATVEKIDAALAEQPLWILVQEEDNPVVLLAAVDLVRTRKENPELEGLDLRGFPGKRLQTAAVDIRATLHEAKEKMTTTGAEALYVISQTVPGLPRVYGVLTQEDVESGYRY